jgi:hypothetical protein
MIRQYLLNKNKNTIVLILQKKMELNKTLIHTETVGFITTVQNRICLIGEELDNFLLPN